MQLSGLALFFTRAATSVHFATAAAELRDIIVM
jgi:hypothetical protein